MSLSTAQQDYKLGMSPTSAVAHADFSMNFTIDKQHAIQGYHWNKGQLSVHPLIIYTMTANGEVSNK